MKHSIFLQLFNENTYFSQFPKKKKNELDPPKCKPPKMERKMSGKFFNVHKDYE